MFRNIGRFIFLLVILMNLFISVMGQEVKVHPDDKLYDKVFIVRGKIDILNHPTLGKTEGRNISVLFQKVGCKTCLILTTSDSDGNYVIGLSKGKYKVIMRFVRGGSEPSFDLLAPSQPRILNVTKSNRPIEFNIQMMLSED